MSSHVAATGTAQTHVAPDRATLTLVIRVLAPESLQKAAQQMAPLERAVLEALLGAGVARDRIATERYATGRERLYQRDTWVHGYYYVDHVLSVEVDRLDTVGAVLAAARKGGVTRVEGVSFWLRDDEAHREAMTRRAVAQAVARARTLAEASGGRLGPLVRLGTRDALAATLGHAASVGAAGFDGALFAAAPAMQSEGEDAHAEPLLLPVPIEVRAEVHGAWEVLPGGLPAGLPAGSEHALQKR